MVDCVIITEKNESEFSAKLEIIMYFLTFLFGVPDRSKQNVLIYRKMYRCLINPPKYFNGMKTNLYLCLLFHEFFEFKRGKLFWEELKLIIFFDALIEN